MRGCRKKQRAIFAVPFLVFVLLNLACGESKEISEKYALLEHDPFFDPYTDVIQADYNAIGKHVDVKSVPIAFQKTRKQAYAFCAFYNMKARYIVVSSALEEILRSEPASAADRNLKAGFEAKLDYILRHELGHCAEDLEDDPRVILLSRNIETRDPSRDLFGRQDRTGEIQRFIPASIMYPIFLNPKIYKAHKSYYDLQMLNDTHPEDLVEEKPQMSDSSTLTVSPSNMTIYIVKDRSGHEILRTKSEIEFLTALSHPIEVDINLPEEGYFP